MDGIVKWYNKEEGIGYILGDDKKEYFFTKTLVKRNTDGVKPNIYCEDRVHFILDSFRASGKDTVKEVTLIEKSNLEQEVKDNLNAIRGN